MRHLKPILSPKDLKDLLSLTEDDRAFIDKSRGEIRGILEGTDSRCLLIVGPCSVHDLKSTQEYAEKLKRLSEKVSDHLLLVMRVYFEKPRTRLGWKGFLYDPDLNNSNDIAKGMFLTRQLLIALTKQGIPLATEFLEPTFSFYFDDLISWGCIGARTVTSQTHRQMASGLPMPMGFKNTIEGNIEAAVDAIISCAQDHTHIGINSEGSVAIVHTKGNKNGHLVLRGSNLETNYDAESITKALKTLKKANQPLRLLVDCSHGNSKRLYEEQCHVFQSLIKQILEGNSSIRGVLLESHLHAGNQQMIENPKLLKHGVSITDSCIDWPTTENLILWAYQKIQHERSLNPPQYHLNFNDFALQKIN